MKLNEGTIFCIIVVVLILAFCYGYTVNSKNSIEYAKAGLERCQYRGNKTIWVKSCTEYLNAKKD